jgi:hypothetical protein
MANPKIEGPKFGSDIGRGFTARVWDFWGGDGHPGGAPYSQQDGNDCGPFETFAEAAEAVCLFYVNEAITSLWVDPEFRSEAQDGQLTAEAKAFLDKGQT